MRRTLLMPFILLPMTLAATCRPDPPPTICGDGRQQVDIRSIALTYDRLGFTISAGWQGIAVQVGLTPTQVQKIEETTQNWNQYIQGAGLAHNGCSGSKDQFGKLLARYDSLKRTKEVIEGLLGTVPANGQISRELQAELSNNFKRYFELVSAPRCHTPTRCDVSNSASRVTWGRSDRHFECGRRQRDISAFRSAALLAAISVLGSSSDRVRFAPLHWIASCRSVSKSRRALHRSQCKSGLAHALDPPAPRLIASCLGAVLPSSPWDSKGMPSGTVTASTVYPPVAVHQSDAQ